METLDKFCIVIFGLIGIIALIGAMFFGAHHHYVTCVLCAIMVWVSILDIRKEKSNESND
jgi:hypothetical protein